MSIKYAYINGAFVPLDNLALSFMQAELFACRQHYAVPILQTHPLLTDGTALLAQRCAQVQFHQQAELQGETLRNIISELISRNRYFQDAYADVSVHPDLGGDDTLQLSVVLRPLPRFTTLKTGLACKVLRSLYSQAYLPSGMQHVDKKAQTAVTCYVQQDGYIRATSLGGIAVIKSNNCYFPRISNSDLFSPVSELIAETAKKIGLNIHIENVSEQDLLSADEVLFPHPSSILEWCSAYGNRRYFSRKFKLIASTIVENATSL